MRFFARGGLHPWLAVRFWLAAGLLLATLAGLDIGQLGSRTAWADEPAAKPAGEEEEEDAMPDEARPRRFKAPSLEGGVGWINTAGPLDLKDLRGKFVLLDFWTYCCINCMHILPELKKLEHKYPNEIVVIGVHTAKFDTEKDSKNITEAVLRYEIEHPVINDANYAIWQKFEVNSWPSLRVIDPEGYIFATHSGEITFKDLDGFFSQAIAAYKQKGTLNTTPLQFNLERARAEETPLRFPGKVWADEVGDRLFIADSNHNRIVVTKLDGSLLQVIGSGQIGRQDGGFEQATFDHPQGMFLHNDRLFVADTENHMIREANLTTKQVRTVAGTGVQSHSPFPGANAGGAAGGDRYVGPTKSTALSSPWALWVHDEALYIAMAGPHQIWRMPLDESEIGPYAGNGREDIVDGPLLPKEPFGKPGSSFAQPSGLASDGQWLYVADSEGSSIRAVPLEKGKKVKTVVGTASQSGARLFTFGDVDGKGREVRLQHPLDVVYLNGSLYVADTYNSKIKVIDPKEHTAATLAIATEGSAAVLDEPAGLAVANGKLYVADTNAHRIRVIDLEQGNAITTLEIAGLTPPAAGAAAPLAGRVGLPERLTDVPPVKLKASGGQVRLAVQLTLPQGWKINPMAPMSYQMQTAAATGPVDREAIGKRQKVTPPAAEFEIPLAIGSNTGNDVLQVSVNYYYCLEGAEGLCKMGTVTWKLPLEVSADAGEPQAVLRHTVE